MNWIKWVAPLGIVGVAVAGFSVLLSLKTEPPMEVGHKGEQAVQAIYVKPTDVALKLPSQGLIEARRVTVLSAEVGGRVVSVSPKFEAGQIFSEGEILLEIDSADYQAALSQAEATLADAKLLLANEQAKAEQALRDWQKLAASEKPSDLAARKPHIESASAKVKAAEAAIVKAKRDVERTKVAAPYRGKLRAKFTELGSVLAPGLRVAELYSVDSYEVRLPLSLEDSAYLPEGNVEGSQVQLSAQLGGKPQQWTALVNRMEGEVDRGSRNVYLVAKVDAKDELLKPGLYVNGSIQGRSLQGVLRVPRKAFLDEDHLLTVDAQSKLHLRQVKPLRAEGSDMLVAGGISQSERVVLTALSAPIEGMEVKVLPESSSTGSVP
jgi:RND family efflux transporter MFP subunit